jgi:hypothetical protein
MARQVIHHQIKTDPTYDYAFVDTACDTCGLGRSAWVLDTMTERKVQVAGYDHQDTAKDNVPIGSGITAIDLPDGETILLTVNEATILGNAAHLLLSVIQLRENGIEVDDKPRRHGGTSCMMVEDYVIPFVLIEGMVSLKIRKPTSHELDTCELVELTGEMPWHPEHINDKELSQTDYGELIDNADKRHMAIRKTRRMAYDPKHYSPYFLYPGDIVMQKTLENTTQYGSINMRVPMQQHYKSRNPILQRRRINEPYATDTWFSTVTSYEGTIAPKYSMVSNQDSLLIMECNVKHKDLKPYLISFVMKVFLYQSPMITH